MLVIVHTLLPVANSVPPAALVLCQHRYDVTLFERNAFSILGLVIMKCLDCIQILFGVHGFLRVRGDQVIRGGERALNNFMNSFSGVKIWLI